MLDDLESRVRGGNGGSWKEYFADTSARILFYVPAIGVWEKFVVDMENKEVLKSRLGAVIVNLAAGYLHRRAREVVAAISHTSSSSPKLRQGVADTAAGFIVGLSTYAVVLYIAGASLQESLMATPFALLFTTCTGHPYGRFLDWYRRKWRTKPLYGIS